MKLKPSIAIIGPGRLGGALALALSKKNYEIRQLVSRAAEKAQKIAEMIEPEPEILSLGGLGEISAEIVFITTPDSEIQSVAEDLAEKLKRRPVVFHTSGARSSEILQGLKSQGCPTGSFHPLVSISDSLAGAERFRNAFFCLEGDREAHLTGEKIIKSLKGKAFFVATKYKTLYHAAAVMASGHLTALFSAAVETLAACGLGEKEAQKVLYPLVMSAIENLSAQTPAEALTGTFARADLETLKLHLESLRENASEEVFTLYRRLGLRSLSLAEKQGQSAEKLAAMRELLDEKTKT